MPRIPTRVILDAYRHDRLLPLLLRECRSINSAKNELRWLRERAVSIAHSKSTNRAATLLKSMCRARSRGVPLQYILSDQPFGELDILCKRGVLIPRADTETFTSHAASLISRDILKIGRPRDETPTAPLRIIDLCTGTGCISLLLHALLAPRVQQMSIVGVDISATAINLARRNLIHNVQRGSLSDRAMTDITFRPENVLQDVSRSSVAMESQQLNVVISNPPYISTESFTDGTTTRSVRIPEDIFYYHILSLSFNLKAGLVVLECGDRLQGRRVAALCNTLAQKYSRMDGLHVTVWPPANQGLDGSPPEDIEPCIVILHRTGSN
ncbi:S-adenosyl-L-methionine-dependent methyltransferase [Aspergillus ellipticus CBS 707.79]|uniref:S-adenosyl-L-methionine-dependent methyltransferase n=1 Tax=Aspergillus ellipticus CBS 707.79 TaxID=1448320 RepID=A0A319DGZ0_9EURO|nr:S-adenosyl-L-methionine-dependent methyltransferase [Aspergillus ellipticus CBS 707.79]